LDKLKTFSTIGGHFSNEFSEFIRDHIRKGTPVIIDHGFTKYENNKFERLARVKSVDEKEGYDIIVLGD